MPTPDPIPPIVPPPRPVRGSLAEVGAVFLEIGTRSQVEFTTYVDVDLVQERDTQGRRMLHKSGQPY